MDETSVEMTQCNERIIMWNMKKKTLQQIL